jgi:hypothetical protein
MSDAQRSGTAGIQRRCGVGVHFCSGVVAVHTRCAFTCLRWGGDCLSRESPKAWAEVDVRVELEDAFVRPRLGWLRDLIAAEQST